MTAEQIAANDDAALPQRWGETGNAGLCQMPGG